MSNDTFQDFCQAWTSRFPDSELPEAWQEDVRNNLAKHRCRVSQLREELEKEEMYVEYLDKLLNDIELHRSKSKDASVLIKPADTHVEEKKDKTKEELGGVKEGSRLQFLEDQCERHTLVNLRSSLHLDLHATVEEDDDKKPAKNPFVTVISVKSPDAQAKKSSQEILLNKPGSKFTFTRRPRSEDGAGRSASNQRRSSQESLNSVSSPVSPSSPLESLLLDNLLSPREAPASPTIHPGFLPSSSSSSYDPSPTNTRQKPTPPERTVSVRDENGDTKSSSSCEDLHSFQSRGRPDGGEEDEVGSSPPTAPTFSTFAGLPKAAAGKVTDGKSVKPPIATKPEKRSDSVSEHARRPSTSQSNETNKSDRRDSSSSQSDMMSGRPGGLRRQESNSSDVLSRQSSTRCKEEPTPSKERRGTNSYRKDSSSSRVRMGSPGGKSHDSSDNDSWGRRHNASQSSPRHCTEQSSADRAERANRAEGPSNGVISPVVGRKLSAGNVLRPSLGTPASSKDPAPAPDTRTSSLGRSGTLPSRDSTSEKTKLTGPPLPKPRKITRKPRTGEAAEVVEPLYDQVCSDSPEQEDEYDNHLLYAANISGGSSASEDLKSGKGGTLSRSTDTGSFSPSPSLVRKVTEMEEEESNYVNIQYFLQQTRTQIDRQDSRDLDVSEDELTSLRSDSKSSLKTDSKSSLNADPKSSIKADSKSGNSSTKSSLDNKEEQSLEAEAERLKMQTHILNSILDSEAIYLECLSVCLQYMKAMKVTFSTQTPIIPKEDFDVIFYKIPELYEFHHHFHESLKKQIDRWNGEDKIGHHFKMLAQQTKVYAQFLSNYTKALDTLHRCSQNYQQFADLTGSIKLRTLKGQQQGQSVSLEDLLHKPVARVQKNCMSLQDLLKHTPENSTDFGNLSESLRLIQNFLNEYNIEHRGELYPHQEGTSRHLVKNSFIIELSEGVRKLRHLFLFNDVLVCAKYKATSKGEKFTFQLKWYIPLYEALIVEDPSVEPKETKPANIVALKTGAAALRDQIIQIQREDDWRGKGRGKSNLEKPRKLLAEYEAQLVLASPHLLFQVASKSGRTFSFFMSSEYERSQWVETLKTLQSNLPPNTSQAHSLSMVELQSWISSCRKFLKTNMGSFLMRSTRDEPLLIGDLYLVIRGLTGLTRPADLFIVAEIDSYGHYFRKVKTRAMGGTLEPAWNEEFALELEGSENLRLLVYQEGGPEGVVLRGRASLELSRSWVKTEYTQQRISLGDVILTCDMKFVGYEETVRRVPQAKPTGLFKTPILQTTRKEKRAIPFIITSCVREVERRGISEVGIYRVSGSSADMVRIRKAYESNPYEAEQLLKECDIHSVAGILKQYLRDLPECIFTSEAYLKLFKAYSIQEEELRTSAYLQLFSMVPLTPNQACVVFLIEHLVRVSQLEYQNKMSLHNMATVFGPTMLHAGQERDKKAGDLLATSTVDVMAQSGILHFFLTRRARGEPIQISEQTL